MRFLYEYRTPDNAKHNGVVCASDREAAYALLKKQGIKPCRFEEAPGILNKVFGKGKRWIAIVVLAIACVTLTVMVGRIVRNASQPSSLEASLDSLVRRQPIGDAAIIDEGIRTGWAGVFESEGERFLASFAIPGTPPAVRSTTEEELRKVLDPNSSLPTSNSSLLTHHSSLEQDSLEARQVRAMVEGMKQELREFLADGGTIRQYGNRLVQRQEAELGYYRRAKTEVDRAFENKVGEAELSALLTKHNTGLRRMGIKLLVMPE